MLNLPPFSYLNVTAARLMPVRDPANAHWYHACMHLHAGGAVVGFGAPMSVCGDAASAYATLNQIRSDFGKAHPDVELVFQTWVNNNDVVPRLLGLQNKGVSIGELTVSLSFSHAGQFEHAMHNGLMHEVSLHLPSGAVKILPCAVFACQDARCNCRQPAAF